ncbi:MAG: hypothetical protein IJE43_21910 [Alphaproteobacteria bacterium]|nr:hypothetical protein [Alphaproteobacteria bacterium]
MGNVEDLDFIYVGPLEKVNKNTIMPKNGIIRQHKPLNAFWTSPVNPKTGLSDWEEWCNNGNFRVYNPQIEKRLHIVPKKDCRILTILPDSPELEKYTISTGNHYPYEYLDFEAIAKDYDAVYVPKETVWKHNDELLYAWDVATCVFLRPKFNVLNEKQYQEYKKKSRYGLNLLFKKKSRYELNQNDTHSGVFNPVIPKDLPKVHPIKRLYPVDNSKENLIRDLKALRLAGKKEEFDAFVESIESSSESNVTEILKKLTKFHKFEDFDDENDVTETLKTLMKYHEFEDFDNDNFDDDDFDDDDFYDDEKDYHYAKNPNYNHAKVLLSPTVLKTCLKHGLVPDNDFLKNITSYQSLQYSFFNSYIDSSKLNREAQKLLLQYGAEPDIEIFDLDLYLRAGGNPNTGNLLVNVLKNTIGTKETEILSLSASADADPEAVDIDCKALEIAKAIEMLLSAGADPEAVDKDGKSALEIAKEDPICYSRVYKIKYIEQAIKQKREKVQKGSDNENKAERTSVSCTRTSKDFTPDM